MDKYLLPQPIDRTTYDGTFRFQSPKLIYEGKDERVLAAARHLLDAFSGGDTAGTLKIAHENLSCEAYTLCVNADGVDIRADCAAGAFYALQTLTQLLIQGKDLSFLEIHDRPQFVHRGLYHDVTRGRIPTLKTLMELADTCALYKINSIQLYVEHSFDFKEYRQINQGQQPLTAQEIRAFDRYCRERFIELIPSLSCFGHLYNLLQSDQYRHLCELENYLPTHHLWQERMAHHTIDASNPESFSLITSLLDQYLPLFETRFFNICCDETFDLCKGRNAGKDSGALYLSFVTKLIDYLESRGKTVMLWGDIVLKHMDLLPKFPKHAILLNWDYAARPPFEKIQCFERAGCRQIVCPGVSGWSRLSENMPVSESNIRKMAAYGKLCGAYGLLNTNWGDYGHLSDPETVMFGILLGAAEAWNPGAVAPDNFDRAVETLYYQNDDGRLIRAMRLMSTNQIFKESFRCYCAFTAGEPFRLDNRAHMSAWRNDCETAAALIQAVLAGGSCRQESVQALLYAAQGYTLLAGGLLLADSGKADAAWAPAFQRWRDAYAARWKQKNKADELPIVLEFFDTFARAVQNDP